jgi:hypothetical protein
MHRPGAYFTYVRRAKNREALRRFEVELSGGQLQELKDMAQSVLGFLDEILVADKEILGLVCCLRPQEVEDGAGSIRPRTGRCPEIPSEGPYARLNNRSAIPDQHDESCTRKEVEKHR